MVNIEYHKGSFCVYSAIFCQEGYCSECEIYLKRSLATKQVDRYEVVKSQRAPKLDLVH